MEPKTINMLSAFAVAMAALCVQAREPVRIDLAGEWSVVGTNFAGKVHLPGTFADAGLGRVPLQQRSEGEGGQARRRR